MSQQTRKDGAFNTVTASRGIFGTISSQETSAGFLLSKDTSVDITTTTRNVTPSESGTTFFVKSAPGSTIFLPEPAAGLKYHFIIGSNPIAGNVDITAPTAGTIFARAYGPQVTSGADYAGAVVPSVGFQTFRFVGGSSSRADDVEFTSDGSFWYGKGVAALAAGIVFV